MLYNANLEMVKSDLIKIGKYLSTREIIDSQELELLSDNLKTLIWSSDRQHFNTFSEILEFAESEGNDELNKVTESYLKKFKEIIIPQHKTVLNEGGTQRIVIHKSISKIITKNNSKDGVN